jgi:uncharacterized protein YeaO (DUF488 family)
MAPAEGIREMPIQTKRVYEPYDDSDGNRYLVERLWPRGIRKEDLRLTAWLKDLSPSPELRKWYSHDTDKYDEFRSRYRKELAKQGPLLDQLVREAQDRMVTLLYAAADREHSSARLLCEFLDFRLRD